MRMSSHPLSRALPSRRIDAATRPLPTLLSDSLDAKTCRFHAAKAVDVPNSMTTPLTDRVRLANVWGAELVDRRHGSPWHSSPGSPRAAGAVMVSADDELTDGHMRLLEWLSTHPTGSLAAAAQALRLAVSTVERLCADLVDAEMIARAPMQ